MLNGIGYHHAGLEISDRKTIESMFSQGDLPVLCELESRVGSMSPCDVKSLRVHMNDILHTCIYNIDNNLHKFMFCSGDEYTSYGC